MGFTVPTIDFDIQTALIHLLVLFTAIPLHELAHAWAADRLGDPTPRRDGRLTFHPMAHMDLFGSLALVLFGFGWGRSVRVNSGNFRHPRRDRGLVALAGPLTNILVALAVLILSKPILAAIPAHRAAQGEMAVFLLSTLIMTNLYLAVFNLIPMPPLDGYQILGSFLPRKASQFISDHQNGVYLILAVLLITGLLQIPLRMGAYALFRLLAALTSPLDALFY